MHTHNPVWSPDGQWIYFVHGTDPTGKMDVWRMQPSGESPEQLTHQNAPVNFLAPLDARTLLYVARAEDWSGPWLWALDVESKVTRRVTAGLEQYTSVSASRDGRRVVATVANPTASLWRVPLLDRLVEDRDAQPYAVPTERALAPRFGGTSLFYLSLSARGTGDGLWRCSERAGVRSAEGRRRRVVRAPGGVAGRQPRGGRRQTAGETAPRHHVGRRHQLTNPGCRPSTSRARWGKAPLTGRPTAPGSSRVADDGQGPGLFKIPVDGGAARAARPGGGPQSGLVAEG